MEGNYKCVLHDFSPFFLTNQGLSLGWRCIRAVVADEAPLFV